MKKILIVLDSLEYKKEEVNLKKYLDGQCHALFFYSKYENCLTELFQRTKYVGAFLTHLTYWALSLSYAFKILVSKYSKVESILFINPIVGIFFASLKRLFRLRQNISIAGFLFENKRNYFYHKLRFLFVVFCYREVDNIFVYGEDEVVHYQDLFPSLKNKFRYIRYGRDFDYQNKKDFIYDLNYIASGGRSNRDYITLCKAIQLLNQKTFLFDCLIATRPECVTFEMEKMPVKFQYGISLNQFGSFLEHSSLFVLPLLNVNLSAGHMAMMEAMANGKLIIVADIPAIRDYVSDNEVIFYRAGDYHDLADKIATTIEYLYSPRIRQIAENGKLLYNNEYSFKAMIKRIITKVIN